MLDLFFQKNSKTIVSSKSKDKTYLPIIASFMLVMFFVPFEYILFGRTLNPVLFGIGITICLLATFIRVKGQLDLKNGFSTRIEKQEGHELVTTGLYGLIRHPLYLAIILFMVGSCLMLSAQFSWIVALVCIFTLKVRIDREEEFLSQNFEGYKAYQQRTKKIIPFVW